MRRFINGKSSAVSEAKNLSGVLLYRQLRTCQEHYCAVFGFVSLKGKKGRLFIRFYAPRGPWVSIGYLGSDRFLSSPRLYLAPQKYLPCAFRDLRKEENLKSKFTNSSLSPSLETVRI